MMTAKELKLRESQADEGCLMAPDETREMLAEIRNLREAMREAMEDKNANADSIGPLGRALGYSRNEWGEWIIPQSPADIPERPTRCSLCGADEMDHYDQVQCPLGNDTFSATQRFTPIPDRPLPRIEKEEWLSMTTVPKNAKWFRLQVRRGGIVEEVIAHWAEDMSGEAQPAFRGFFQEARGGTGFEEVHGTPLGWLPEGAEPIQSD